MLTWLAETIPPRIGHALAKVLGLSTVLPLFCPHCPESDLWAPEEES